MELNWGLTSLPGKSVKVFLMTRMPLKAKRDILNLFQVFPNWFRRVSKTASDQRNV